METDADVDDDDVDAYDTGGQIASILLKTVVNGQLGDKLIIPCRKIAKWGIFAVYGYGGDDGRLKTAMKQVKTGIWYFYS